MDISTMAVHGSDTAITMVRFHHVQPKARMPIKITFYFEKQHLKHFCRARSCIPSIKLMTLALSAKFSRL